MGEGDGMTNATAEQKVSLLTEQARLLKGKRSMIETGLYHGYGSGMALLDAGELDAYVALDCQEENVRLATERGYDALCGDSAELLPALLEVPDHPVLLWLDAHGIPGHAPDDEFPPCPLVAELAAVIACPVTHRVLIDDLHMFEGMHAEHDWPALEDVRRIVDDAGRWTRTERDAIMVLEPIGGTK